MTEVRSGLHEYDRERRREELIADADRLHRTVSLAHRELFRVIAQIDRDELWQGSGAREMAHWLWMRYGLSSWRAHRWIAAAHALDSLPRISGAFASGSLGVDKVVELTRFATPETEASLIPWAQGVSAGAIRRRGDLETRRSAEEAREVESDRRLGWWYFDDGRRFGLEAELPAAQGAVVARALERLADSLPVMPGEEDPCSASARRADALVTLASARISADPDPDRATVVVHASVEALAGERNAQIEGGPVIPPETVQRLVCDGRVQVVVEDGQGNPLGLGRMSREPSAWMLRQLRHRDSECRFPGCGARRFTQAHHIRWWEAGGTTDLENLLLICSFHHRLVHEHGWSVTREPDGEVRWRHRDGSAYRAGPGPPMARSSRRPAEATIAPRESTLRPATDLGLALSDRPDERRSALSPAGV